MIILATFKYMIIMTCSYKQWALDYLSKWNNEGKLPNMYQVSFDLILLGIKACHTESWDAMYGRHTNKQACRK